MKALLIIAVALATVANAPAFAASRGQGYERNDNVNRGDFQLSGARWKTNHKHHKGHQASK